MLHKSSHRLFEAQQTILFEISSIAAVNNELCDRQSKGGIKKRGINFDTPSLKKVREQFSICSRTFFDLFLIKANPFP